MPDASCVRHQSHKGASIAAATTAHRPRFGRARSKSAFGVQSFQFHGNFLSAETRLRQHCRTRSDMVPHKLRLHEYAWLHRSNRAIFQKQPLPSRTKSFRCRLCIEDDSASERLLLGRVAYGESVADKSEDGRFETKLRNCRFAGG